MKNAIEMLKNGQIVLLGEYRGLLVEHKSFVSQKTGKKQEFNLVTHSIETGTETSLHSVKVEEFLPDGMLAGDYVPPVKRGTYVAVPVGSVKDDFGVVSARLAKNAKIQKAE